jgi:TolB-like protein/DNA-binding winged helix-turn-helix (wHTH) protein/Tfp pilus assembly protein PilF
VRVDQPAGIVFQFGENFILDQATAGLRRADRTLRLERIPSEILLLLVMHRGEVVSRDQIVEAVWGKGVFLDTDNSINGAIRKIRQVLKDDPEEPQFVQTITGKGYRFIAPVVEIGPGSAVTGVAANANASSQISLPANSDTQSDASSSRGWWRFGLLAVVLLSIVAAGIHWLDLRGRAASPNPGARSMLAVLPFENFTGDPGQDYFSDGLTEEMISQLGNLDPAHLGVIARTSVMRYKHTQESLPQIGTDLGVQYVIEGSVRRDSERVRITAQLIQVKDQTHLWAREYDRDLGHLLELQEEISREVADEIEVSLGGRRPTEAARPVSLGTKSYEAYDLYLKGRFFWNKRTTEGFRQAADYFQEAIEKDPNYGRAYAGLADTFSLMSAWYLGPQKELMSKARAAAMRALELDESLAEAHASLALIEENYDYDWPGAEKEFRRAIELDPQYATAHQWYAEFLSWQGRFEEAFAESERARQLDPLSPIIASDHASLLYYSRQYERAVKQYRSALELDPNFNHARGMMVPVNLQLGRYDEAIEGIEHWEDRDHSAWAWAWEAAVYGRWGYAEEARRALARLDRMTGSQVYRTATLLVAYAGMGERERVIELLQTAYEEHSNVVVQIKVDPMYDGLRSDPRFVSLLRSVKLEQ